MRRLLPGLLLPLLLAADRSEIDFDPEADFTQFKTYTLARGSVYSKKPELQNQAMHEKLEAAIRSALAAKGLTEATAKPDLEVEWTVGPPEQRAVFLHQRLAHLSQR